MKTKVILLFLLFSISISSFAQDSINTQTNVTENDIIENLLVGLKSDNMGLKISSMYYLGEREAKKAVLPLMGILKSNDPDDLRIVAALSLFKIGDSRGIFAIKQRIEFEKSAPVKRMCETFYNMYLREQAILNK